MSGLGIPPFVLGVYVTEETLKAMGADGEKPQFTGAGQIPTASNQFGHASTNSTSINPSSAEARNIFADEYGISQLTGHSATRTRQSIGHDDAYFKTDGKIANPAADQKNMVSYDVNADGSVIKTQTHGSREINDLITGTSVKEHKIEADESGFAFSTDAEISREMVGFNYRYGHIMVDGHHYFDSGIFGTGTNMGDMAGSNVGSVRYLFAPSSLFQGAVGVTAGNMPGKEAGILALGGHANSHFFDTDFGKDNVRFSLDAQSKLAVPVIGNGSVLNDLTLSSLVTAGVEYDLNSDITLGAKMNSNIDFAHALNDISELPITNFLEMSAGYNHSHFDVGANIYIPLTVFDDSFSDHITWNLQGGVGTNIFWGATRAGISASLSGNLENPSLSKISVNGDIGIFSAGVNLSGIDTGDISLGVNAKVSLNFPSMIGTGLVQHFLGIE